LGNEAEVEAEIEELEVVRGRHQMKVSATGTSIVVRKSTLKASRLCQWKVGLEGSTSIEE
jgi:hypothetical protein